MVPVSKVEPNPWNPNVQTKEIFEKEKQSITKHGFFDPVTLRPLGRGKFQIIDGEHRWRAAKELGLAEIPYVDMGKLTDDVAMELTLLANDLRGQSDAMRLAVLVKRLSEKTDALLPYGRVDVDHLLHLANGTTGIDPKKAGQGPGASALKDVEKGVVLFQFGDVVGHVKYPLYQEFLKSYERLTKKRRLSFLGYFEWLMGVMGESSKKKGKEVENGKKAKP